MYFELVYTGHINFGKVVINVLGLLELFGLGGAATGGAYLYAQSKGKSVLRCLVDPAINAALQSFNEKNAYVDVSTGEAKSGLNKLLGDIMSEIGKILSDKPVPAVSDVRFFDKDNMYFDYTLAKKVKDSLPDVLKQLETISTTGLLAEYRGKTFDLIKTLLSELEKYCECFSVFTVDKRFKIISVNVNYDKVLKAKKQMIAGLKNIEKSINDYKPERFTAAFIGKLFVVSDKELQELDYDNLVKRRALNYLNDAIDCLKEYTIAYNAEMGKNVNWWEFGGAIGAISDDYSYSSEDQKRIIAARQAVVGIKSDNLSDTQKLATRGGIACRRLAERDLAPLKNLGGVITAQKQVIPSVLFGDYALKIKESVEYTLNNISQVINVGAKKGSLIPENKSLFGVNLKILLGEEYTKDVERWSKRERVIHKSVDKRLLGNADACYLKAKKEYEKITNQRNKMFGDNKDKWQSNVSKLIVTLESKSAADGKKEFDLNARFDELTKDHKLALNNSDNKDYVAVCLRKSEKFLRACERWNEDFQEHKDKEKQRNDDYKLVAKNLMDEAKKHYKGIMKKYEVTRKQDEETKKRNKESQKNLKEAYKKIPTSVSKFIESSKYEGNKDLTNDFIAKKDF